MPGADCYGQWEHAGGPPVVIDGGPTPGTVHQQVGDVSSPASTICPHGSPTLGHNGVAILEGDGCHLDPQVGSGCSSDWSTSHQQQQQQRPTSNHCSAEKEAKGKGRWKGPERPTDKHTTRGRAVAGDDARLEEEVSIAQILSALPRWILRTRTPFAAFLARSFHIKRCGSSPTSTVFPVPAPHLGLFDAQATSRLSARKWTRLCLQRALHVVVMALNYIHSGNAFVPISALGRRPNANHLAIYGRIRSLLTACSRPGSHPLPPGRSGFEFIARLTELEHFASSHEAFCTDLYAGVSEEAPRPLQVCGRIEKEHAFQTKEKFSPVNPYRSLQADRLKLSGTGQWDMAEYLTDILWLPFLEPEVLAHGRSQCLDGPDFSRENYEQNLALARIWDARGLLAIFHKPHHSGLACRVLNAHKNSTTDRQIGDRRWFNSRERHVQGPSCFLPAGPNISSFHCPLNMRLIGCASDRKDFYHQSLVSRERASSNQLPFEFPADLFGSSEAFEALVNEVQKPGSREEDGDRYGKPRKKTVKRNEISSVWLGFKSLFQGDHLGVEFALSSHAELLQRSGLLAEESSVLRHHLFPKGPLWEGLVIDDYFAVSRESLKISPEDSASVRCLEKAEETYKEAGVFGSPEKMIRGEENFKVIGAEVFSDHFSRSAGVVTVSAPAAKRIPMIALSLKSAALPIISKALASRLAGNWVSVFMYRRVCSCILSKIFSLGPQSTEEANDVLPLPRAVADELTLASVLGLVAVTDISVPYHNEIFATDASMQEGAITAKPISEELSETLWLGGDRKGAYTLLDNEARSQLRQLGCDVDAEPVAEDFPAPPKQLPFYFDAVEICGGSGVLSKALAARGLEVCPPIDLSNSKHYDLRDLRLVEWIYQMIAERRFKSVICEPVCATSAAPCVALLCAAFGF